MVMHNCLTFYLLWRVLCSSQSSHRAQYVCLATPGREPVAIVLSHSSLRNACLALFEDRRSIIRKPKILKKLAVTRTGFLNERNSVL